MDAANSFTSRGRLRERSGILLSVAADRRDGGDPMARRGYRTVRLPVKKEPEEVAVRMSARRADALERIMGRHEFVRGHQAVGHRGSRVRPRSQGWRTSGFRGDRRSKEGDTSPRAGPTPEVVAPKLTHYRRTGSVGTWTSRRAGSRRRRSPRPTRRRRRSGSCRQGVPTRSRLSACRVGRAGPVERSR